MFSEGGRRRIVRHVGSARDEAELGLLVEEARRLLADYAQRELDLGITPKAVTVEMVPLPAATLFSEAAGSGVAARQLVARPRVLKSCSGLLYDALAGVYASLGFDEAVGDEVFRDLVIAPGGGADQPARRRSGPGRVGPRRSIFVDAQTHPAPCVRGWLP